MSAWRRLEAKAPSFLNTRLALHHAAQLLASFGQTLVEARADDSHRSMTWDDDGGAFRSEPSPDGLRALLRPSDFTLEVRREDRRLDSLDLHGRTPGEARSWLAGVLAEARGGDEVAMGWPEYELPQRPGGDEAPFDVHDDALAELAAWYGDAALALTPVARLPEASVVRCWPHHFDLATLLTFPPAEAEGEARYVGVGFSPGDESLTEPYYYVNGWPPPTAEGLPGLEGPGSWNTDGWVGAVLGSQAIVARLDAAEQEATVDHFLDAAVAAMRAAVLPES